MKKEILIDLPFEWCSCCREVDLVTSKLYADGEACFVKHTCSHDYICKECKRAEEIVTYREPPCDCKRER